jgi:flavodoxin
MRTLVVYDSVHGNTEKVALAVGEALGALVRRVGETTPADLHGFELVIVGSPTHGGFPTEAVHNFLKRPLGLAGVSVAAFDTRTKTTVFGYAAPKMAKALTKSGGTLSAPPEGFFVHGTKGPLLDGEVGRAISWGRGLSAEVEGRGR